MHLGVQFSQSQNCLVHFIEASHVQYAPVIKGYRKCPHLNIE